MMDNEQELSEDQRNQIAAQKIKAAKAETRGKLGEVPINTIGAGAISDGSIAQSVGQLDAYFQKVRAKHQQ
jgi:hypothetical protein